MLIHTHIRTHTHRRKEIIDDIGRTVCVRRRNKICPFLFPIFFSASFLAPPRVVRVPACLCACVCLCLPLYYLHTHAHTRRQAAPPMKQASSSSPITDSLKPSRTVSKKKKIKKKRNQNRMNPTRKEVPWEKVRDQRRRWRPRERRVTNAS